jgi:hypothetical protein
MDYTKKMPTTRIDDRLIAYLPFEEELYNEYHPQLAVL